MNRVPVSTHIRRNVGGNIVADALLHVYERGTETHTTVYTSETGAGTASQPLTSDSEGRFPDKWIEAGQYDHLVTTPQDQVGTPQEVEAAPGRPWRDGGFAHSKYNGVLPRASDVVVGPYPPPDVGIGERGHQITNGSWYTSVGGRWFLKGAVTVPEVADPGEVIVRSQAGRFPWGPMGPTALLGADVSAGGTVFYALRERGIPLASYNTAGIPFKVGDQTVVYGDEFPADDVSDSPLATIKLCGDHAAGATELLVVRSELDWPSSGYTILGDEYITWTGIEEAFTATLTADLRPGDSTASLSTTVGLPAAGMIEGTTSGGARTAIRYGSVDSATTLGSVTQVTKRFASGSTVRVMRLTGVSTVVFVDTMLTAPVLVGATEIELIDLTDAPSDATEVPNPENLPDSGSATLSTYFDDLQQTISWASKSADSRKLLGVTGIDSGITLNGVDGESLGTGVPHGSALTYVAVGAAGLAASKQNTGRADLVKHTPASGFVSGVSAGAVCQFLPRERAPAPTGNTIGLIHANSSSPGGYQSRNATIEFTAIGDTRATDHYGGEMSLGVGTRGPGTDRRQIITLTDHGAGIPSAEGRGELDHPWHVHGPHVRIEVQTMGGTVTTAEESTRGWPDSGRFQLQVFNRDTNAEETREFDYTDLGSDNESFTGVTYDGTGGHTISDFVALGGSARIAEREQFQTIVGRKQVQANEGEDGETTIGNVGPTAASPEPGIAFGPDGTDGTAHASGGTLLFDNEVLATETYADLLAQGVKWKETCRVATTANIALANLQTVDGVSLAAGERVLVKNQTAQTENGLYLVVAGGAWTRTTDADVGTELEAATVAVALGTTHGNTTWRQTTQPVTLGSSNIVWTEMAGLTTAGAGLTRSGNTVDAVAGDSSLTVAADSVAVADGGITAAKIGSLPAARATRTTVQTIATATSTLIAFDSEDYDTASMHDTATNNSRVTISQAGIYAIAASVRWAANAIGDRRLQILKNGVGTFVQDRRNAITGGAGAEVAIATDLALAANDYIEVLVTQNSGGNLDIAANPALSVRWVGPAP